MTRTALDQMIIDANALDVHGNLGTPLGNAKIWAADVWDAMPPGVQDDVRVLYAPAYHRVAAEAIEAAVDALETMHVGAQGAPYVSATKAQLRSTARAHRTKAKE